MEVYPAPSTSSSSSTVLPEQQQQQAGTSLPPSTTTTSVAASAGAGGQTHQQQALNGNTINGMSIQPQSMPPSSSSSSTIAPSSSSIQNASNAMMIPPTSTTSTTATTPLPSRPLSGEASQQQQQPLSAPPSLLKPITITTNKLSSISNTTSAPDIAAAAAAASSSSSGLDMPIELEQVPSTAPLPSTSTSSSNNLITSEPLQTTNQSTRLSSRRAAKVKAVASMGLSLGNSNIGGNGGASSDGGGDINSTSISVTGTGAGSAAADGTYNPATPGPPPLSSRAKRQRNVKFSPAKGPKATGRRTAAAVAAGAIAASGKASAALEESQLPNNDYCETCGGKGHFLCCDGCPRSFHFACLDPPLELDELPTESWYCKVCEAARRLPIPPKGLFGPLLLKVESENPVAFELPMHIKNSFKNVTTGNYGEYVDTNEFRPLSGLGKAGKGGYEERDPYKFKDRQGRTVLCHYCNEPANAQTRRRIVACDFCELHWHLDCVDPPLVGMPPITRRFMCPAHADEVIPDRRKFLKHQKLIKIKDRGARNNGDIEIMPSEGRFIGVKHSPEEIISQGLRYQVPEQIVILDFWTKIKRDRYGQALEKSSSLRSSNTLRGETPQTDETFDLSDSSSLTSMEATPEPPLTAASGGDHPIASTSSADVEMEIEAKGNANGSVPLKRLSSSHRSDREGTDISDGDPPDIDAWQADGEKADLVSDAMMLVGDHSIDENGTPISSTTGSPATQSQELGSTRSRPISKTQSTSSNISQQGSAPYDNMATLLSAAVAGGIEKGTSTKPGATSAASATASQASASTSRQPSPVPPVPATAQSSNEQSPAVKATDSIPANTDTSTLVKKDTAEKPDVPPSSSATSGKVDLAASVPLTKTGSGSSRHSRQISFTLSGKKLGNNNNNQVAPAPPTPAPSSAATTVDDMQVDKEG